MNIITAMIGVFVMLFASTDCLELHLRRTVMFLGLQKLVTFQMCQTCFVLEVWAPLRILVNV